MPNQTKPAANGQQPAVAPCPAGSGGKRSSRRDVLKTAVSYTLFTAVTMHILAPKAQAQQSPPDGLDPGFPPEGL